MPVPEENKWFHWMWTQEDYFFMRRQSSLADHPVYDSDDWQARSRLKELCDKDRVKVASWRVKISTLFPKRKNRQGVGSKRRAQWKRQATKREPAVRRDAGESFWLGE